jgi:carbamoyltransferase
MNILGISCFYHDAAAALAADGRLVSAAQQERFSGRKHDPEFPEDAVAYCLSRNNLSIDDIDCIAFYDKPLLKFDRLLTGYTAEPFRSFRAFLTAMPIWLRRKLWVEHIIRKELEFDGELLFVPHHLSHAAGSFYCSPFEGAAILTVDGVGEWATAAFGEGEGTRITLHSEMRYPHSVGLLYSAFTYYLGFQVNSSEYKIMGLAPYGTPRFADLIRNELVTVHDDGSIHLNLKYFTFHRGLRMTGRKFAKLFGRPRRDPESELDDFHADVAASIQTVTEDILLAMARHVKSQTNRSALCLSGGVALNCKANGRLLSESGFTDIFVQPASGDAGGAVGAALYGSFTDRDTARREQPFFTLGPRCDDVEVRAFLDENDIPYEFADSD